MKEGWRCLVGATKWHYIRNGRSMCGNWMYLGPQDLQAGNDGSPDNCRACVKRLASEQKSISKSFSC